MLTVKQNQMFDSLFLGSLSDITLVCGRSYNGQLVIASVLIAIFSSVCSLEMVDRLSRGELRYLWLSLGVFILGSGVWVMHFIGMLALHLDCKVTYDPWITGLSVLPAILGATVALNTVSGAHVTLNRLVQGGIAMALGIGTMHYAGMCAIRLSGMLRYDPNLLMASLWIVAYLSIAALLLKANFYKRSVSSWLGGCILGGAIASMHYVMMEATYFIRAPDPVGGNSVSNAVSTDALAIVVTFIAILLLLIGLICTYLRVKLVQARLHVNAILESTSQGFVMMDKKGVITECNSAMSAMWGMDEQLLIGRFYNNLITATHIFDDKVDKDLMATSFSNMTPGNHRMEAMLCRSDGSLVLCLVDSNSIFDDEGEIIYSFALISDIS